MINQLTIVGLGLIGTSIATSLQSTRFCTKIVGFDTDIEKGETAHKFGIIQHYKKDLPGALKNADLVVITSDFEEYKNIFLNLLEHVGQTTVITDTSSLKIPVENLAKKMLKKKIIDFVPSNPS